MVKKIFILILLLTSFNCNLLANQKYEELTDETKTLLSMGVNENNDNGISSFSSKEEEIKWLNEKDAILKKYISDPVYRKIFLKTVHYESSRAALEPELILGLITVESYFRKHAISSAGAIGYMQIMPFWTQILGKDQNHNLFNLKTNLRYGCTILKHYIELEKGNVTRALARYNGSLGKNIYPNSVFEKRKIWL